MKNSTLPPVRVDTEFRAEAESVLHEGESLTGFIEATVRRAVEHRRIQAAFEAGARKSLAEHKRTGASHAVGDVFDKLEAKVRAQRAQVLGQ
jgi:hypothetical protein